jgi:hypothetical protein
MLLARVDGGFVAELTYGESADWYRNAISAGGCVVVVKGVEYHIGFIVKYPYRDGIRMFGWAAGIVLRVLRLREFRLLRVTG